MTVGWMSHQPMEIIMRKVLMLAAALAVIAGPTLVAAPAFASHVSPQTFWNTPDPQSQQAAAPANSNAKSTAMAPQTGQFNQQSGQAQDSRDPMDPDVNPHWLRSTH
jgi:hypothetical protein